MTWNLFSLALVSATSWALLAIGYLPVNMLRKQVREPILAVGAWALVAATAPVAVYHWYLIFAMICLVAWTRLDRPAGKMWLAVVGALGLSLGIVFPLEAAPDSLARENPFALASLYLGGAVTGLAYAVFVVARGGADVARRPAKFAQALVIAAVAWTALLLETTRNTTLYSRPLAWLSHGSSHTILLRSVWPVLPAIVLVLLAFLAFAAARRQALKEMQGHHSRAGLCHEPTGAVRFSLSSFPIKPARKIPCGLERKLSASNPSS